MTNRTLQGLVFLPVIQTINYDVTLSKMPTLAVTALQKSGLIQPIGCPGLPTDIG